MKKVLSLLGVLMFLTAAALFADKSPVPKLKKYYSANSNYCFLVLPGGDGVPCKGTLYQTGYKAGLLTLWSANLVNPVSPLKVIVPDNGKYVVTFDDWDSPGITENMIVIYGASGKMVKRFSIGDFVNNKLLQDIPESKDGYAWLGKTWFEKDGEVLGFEIILMNEDGNKTVKLLLKTGERTE
ncbi:MAG: hypothetical protein A2Y33_14080 [Spirochaetes bacterium GWF1_51_8]|nr:MAG: hypothetical protein A2Y33_14080 [Spirochaetes bacterium GWF1_51_8]